MTKPRRFKSRRDTRPPTPFVIEFEVEELREEKTEDPEADGGYRVELIPTGNWVTEERTFHYTHRFPGQIGLDIQGVPTDPGAANRQREAIEQLLRRTIVEQAEWWELMNSDRYIVDGAIMNELINAIIQDGGGGGSPTQMPGS